MNIIKIANLLNLLKNVLLYRGLNNFFNEIYDLIFIDLKFGTSTYLRKNDLNSNYVPYYSKVFKENISKLSKKINISNTYFVDLGSGKGRILLASLDFNFKKRIGIELEKELFLESQKYLIKNNLTKKIFLFNYNFINLKFKFKKGTNVLFFWYGPGNLKFLKQIMIKFKKRFKNKIYFYIIPDIIPKISYKILVLNHRKFKKDKTRNSLIIRLK